jgi:hypothetical protein
VTASWQAAATRWWMRRDDVGHETDGRVDDEPVFVVE